MPILTNTLLDKILDGDVTLSDLSLSVEETKQVVRELEARENTRENCDSIDDASNKQFLQEENHNSFSGMAAPSLHGVKDF